MKKVLITGGSSGLGLTLVKLLKDKYEVYYTYYNNKDIVKELDSDNCHGIYLDLSNKESIEKCYNWLPSIDILINNACVYSDNDIKDKDYDEFNYIVSTNISGTYYLTKLISKDMLDNKDGNIVFISSTNGIDTYYPESIDYDASKAGIISMMHNFANYLAPYIRVNTVAPGWINTPMNKDISPLFKKNEEDKILLGRFSDTEEIANVVLFLIDDKSSYVNDSVIRVDGGKKC